MPSPAQGPFDSGDDRLRHGRKIGVGALKAWMRLSVERLFGGPLARIAPNRPQAMNAYTFALCGELQAAIAAFRDEDELTVLILTGAGNRAFCTGGDIGGSDEAHRAAVAAAPMGRGREMRDGMQAAVLALTKLDKPSIAMIRGFAVAGGLALALACNFRFAAQSARLGDTSNKVGLLPDEGGAWLFP